MNSWRLAWLHLSRRKVPTLIALLAISVSVACSGLLLRTYNLSASRFASMASGGDVVVGAKAGGIEIILSALNAEGPYPDFLPYVLYESLKSEEKVHFADGADSQPSYLEAVIPFVYFAKYKNYRVIGTDESFFTRPRLSDSLHFAEGRWASGPAEVVIGRNIADEQQLHLGSEVVLNSWTGSESSSSEFKFQVVGILESVGSIWDHSLFSNVAQAQEIIGGRMSPGQSIWKNSVLNYFLIYLKPNGLAPLKALVNQRTVGQVAFVPEEKQRLFELTGTGKKLGILIVSFIMLLGGLSVAGVLMTRFEAMGVQLAVLRALGYSRMTVTRWLLYEGLILGLSACVIGGLCDALFFPILRASLGSALPPADLVSSSILQSSPVWIIAIVFTILAVTVPLIRMYRQNIHISLRSI
jgi:putative ABC transport system permease protein